jgi:N6-L-threonylcarbamoyladenine synthase
VTEARRVDASTLVLGIETSCDETAAALVMGGSDVASSVVSSQVDLHARFGGVVPGDREPCAPREPEPRRRPRDRRGGVPESRIDAVACAIGPG